MNLRFVIVFCSYKPQNYFTNELCLENFIIETENLIARLSETEGRAEIIHGKIIKYDLEGFQPNQAKSNIAFSLRQYQQNIKRGFVVTTLVAYIVDLPDRKSFSPNVSFHNGKRTGMKFLQGAPIFAVEVRSENDYGNKAEKDIAQKRHDYFASGTEIVWDVDLLSEYIINVLSPKQSE